MNASDEFVLFYRHDYLRKSSVIKIEVFSDGRWLASESLRGVDERCVPTEVSAKVKILINLLIAHGMDARSRERLLERKAVFTSADIPLDDILNLGWSIEPYPIKHGGDGILDTNALMSDVKATGIHIDASNAIGDKAVIETRGLAFKGLLDLTRSCGIPTRAYVDYSIFAWLKREGMNEVYDYLNVLLADHSPSRMITESKHGMSVDPILLDWADRSNGHVLSRDGYDDFDMEYKWILRGATNGRPRLHKFSCDGVNIGIPDLGISIPIPTSF